MNTCIHPLQNEKIWRVRQTSFSKAERVLQNTYIDLLCIETNDAYKQILNLFTDIKNKRLKTKILSVVPDNEELKEILLSYGSDDYLCKPYKPEDLILRTKNLINCIPIKYPLIYESKFLKYEKKFNRVMYKKTYIPLTPREVLIIKLLIKQSFVSNTEIQKYLKAKLGKKYSSSYITVSIHRIRKKIKLCTGRNLIRNKYGSGYYIL